ncbi:hypothetical protein Tco_1221249 [Tanacetum coccineum]
MVTRSTHVNLTCLSVELPLPYWDALDFHSTKVQARELALVYDSEEDDINLLMLAYQHHQTLEQQEAQSSGARNPIYRERDVVEARLFGDN